MQITKTQIKLTPELRQLIRQARSEYVRSTTRNVNRRERDLDREIERRCRDDVPDCWRAAA